MKHMKKNPNILKYLKLLPQRITVKVEKNLDEEGYWAKIMELPHCYTQASTISELAGMVTDAIQTHFEIPEKYKKNLGYYVPVSEKHLQLEEIFRKLVSIEQKVSQGKEVKAVFQRAEYAVVC